MKTKTFNFRTIEAQDEEYDRTVLSLYLGNKL
jgi:hypothetical protein